MNHASDLNGAIEHSHRYNAQIRDQLEELHQRVHHAELLDLASDIEKMLAASRRLDELLASPPSDEADTDLRRYRHDLRTPVNQLRGFSELLIEECEDGGDTRWTATLTTIIKLVHTLQKLIDQVGRVQEQHETSPLRPREPSGPHSTGTGIDILHNPRGVVLVVDDDAPNREVLSRLLMRDGFRVITAENGRTGIEQMRQHPIDVVLLDIVMPELDGYETLETIRADRELAHIPIIMLSSLDDPHSITRCIEAGAEDHLPKPFDPVLLRARLSNSLAKKRARDLERSYLRQIVAAKRRADELLHNVIPLGVALSTLRDEGQLLERIVREARRFCGADGGILHLNRDGQLLAVQLQVETLGLSAGGQEAERRAPASISTQHAVRSPVAIAAVLGRTITLRCGAPTESGTAYDLERLHAFEGQHGYHVRSMLCLPLRSPTGAVVGVLELWNPINQSPASATPPASPFEPSTIDILESLSLLAAAALDSYHRELELRRRIQSLEVSIDEDKRRHEVSQITETDYFKQLRDQARELRKTSEWRK